MFDFSNYLTKSQHYDDLNKLVIGKIKDETDSVAIEEFFGLSSKMCSFLLDDNSENEKEKGVNRNIFATMSHNEYNFFLLNNKCLRHSINGIQSKDHRIGTYEINRFSLFCFNGRIYIKNNDMMD